MTVAEKPTWGFRLAPRSWPSLFRQVREQPNDVALGARVFFAVGGHDEGRAHRRFLETEDGRALLEHETPYPKLFHDLPALRALPAGSLGREYVRQLDERSIDPAELSALTVPCYEGIPFTREHAYVRDRVREAHDIIHTLTDCGVDLVGEAGVAGFTFAQTRNKGWAMLILLNVFTGLLAFRLTTAVVAIKGYLRGRRARFLPAISQWEELLRKPLDEARASLNVSPIGSYRPLFLEEVFANAEPQDST